MDYPNWIVVVRELLAAGASLNVRDQDGSTPLMLALVRIYFCSKTSLEDIKELVEMGDDITLTDNSGKTVFYYAVAYDRRIEVVKYLYEKLVAVEGAFLSDVWTGYPVDLIEQEITPFLMVPDIDKADNDGKTPLNVALYHWDFEIVKFLLDKGVPACAEYLRYAMKERRVLLLKHQGGYCLFCRNTHQYSQECGNNLAKINEIIHLLEQTIGQAAE